MKIGLLQPPYPDKKTPGSVLSTVRWMEKILDSFVGQGIDLVVLPEYCNCPGMEDASAIRSFVNDEGNFFADKLKKYSLVLNCGIIGGIVQEENDKLYNRTVLFSQGEIIYKYDKIHLTDAELDMGFSPGARTGLCEYHGMKLGFAVCFDIYFPEYLAALSAAKIDMLICPSYQRSENTERIAAMTRVRAIDSGAWILRSSYAMGPESLCGGRSMLVSPGGEILDDAGNLPGTLIADFNPEVKFMKSASFGQQLVIHRELVEKKRRNCLYRPAVDNLINYRNNLFPRLCAHRGLSLAMPENSIPAFAAALAAGAHEIEFDLWLSADGVPVIFHDSDLRRVAGVDKIVTDIPWDEISQVDIGAFKGEEWKGIKIPGFEDILKLADGSFGMNIHIKSPGKDGILVKIIGELIKSHGLLDCAYIGGDESVLEAALSLVPEVSRACLAQQDNPDELLKAAFKYKCERIQFFPNFSATHTHQASEAGIINNLFYADDFNEAVKYTEKGIDVILSNVAHTLIGSGFNSLLLHSMK